MVAVCMLVEDAANSFSTVSVFYSHSPIFLSLCLYLYQDPAKYDFHYKVKDDYNDFGHWESRDGDKISGKYIVVLPDGRTQTVEYTVDGKSGYVAKVTYDGEPVYHDHNKYKPSSYEHEPVYTPKPYY